MEINTLYNIAETKGITVDFLSLKENPALCLELGGKGFIALDKGLVGRSFAERVALAHELGHLLAGALYKPGEDNASVLKHEQAAQKWAIKILVPLEELIKALKEGNENLSLLAERFEVTEEFMQKALAFYSKSSAV